MKKTILAVALGLAAGSASAAIIEAQDFTVSGEIGVGGYYQEGGEDAGERDFYNDGATGIDLEVKYEKGDVVAFAKGEFDVENDYGMSDADGKMTKLWIGYKTPIGLVSVGTDNDSALDKVDGYADQTIEFGMSASDASDVADVIKLEGAKEAFVYGVSYYNDKNDAGSKAETTGYNGYVGMRTEMIDVNLGYEKNDSDDKAGIESIVMGNAVLKIDALSIGAMYSMEEDFAGDKADLVTLSAAYSINELTIAGGYNLAKIDDAPEDIVYYNVGAKYQFTENLEGLVDVAIDTSKSVDSSEDTMAFVKAVYAF